MNNLLATDLDFILERTVGFWDELRGERIFITGGTGFFGSWLLESFAWANRRLNLKSGAVVLTRNPEAFQKKINHLCLDPAIQFHRGDVMHFAFPAGSFSHIVHAATEASAALARDNPQLMYDTIVQGTQRVLEFAEHCRAQKMLFTSSGAVYGRQPPELSHISEDYVAKYENEDEKLSYGRGKRSAEDMCLQAMQSNQLEVKIARCFAFVGPYLPLDIHFAIGNFILAGLRGEPIVIKGDGTPYRSYLYAAELMVWLWKILFCGMSGRAYNVGSENAVNIAELAYKVAMHFDPVLEVQIAKQPVLGKLAERYVPSVRRAKEELGLEQEIDLDEAIERTKKWYLERYYG